MNTRTIEIKIPIDEFDLASIRGELGSRINQLHKRAMESTDNAQLFLNLTHRITLLNDLLVQL